MYTCEILASVCKHNLPNKTDIVKIWCYQTFASVLTLYDLVAPYRLRQAVKTKQKKKKVKWSNSAQNSDS